MTSQFPISRFRPAHVMPSPSLTVILSGAKNPRISLRVNSAKHLRACPDRREGMTAWRTFFLGSLLLAAPVVQSRAQNDPCLNRTVAVNVTTEDFQSVKGLTTENFEAKLHGKPLDVTSVNYDEGTHRVAILLDVSGSMTGQPDQSPWPEAIFAIKSVLYSAPSHTSFALCTFARGMQATVKFGQSAAAVNAAVEKLEVADWSWLKGRDRYTALWDGVSRAIDLLRPHQPGDAILLVTDGGENVSKESDRDVKEALLQSQTRLFVFLLLDRLPIGLMSPREPSGPGILQNWSESTGGDSYLYPSIPGLSAYLVPEGELEMRARGPKLISETARALADEMSQFYALRIKLPESPKKPTEFKLEIVGALGKKHPPVRVIYPHKLASCHEGA